MGERSPEGEPTGNDPTKALPNANEQERLRYRHALRRYKATLALSAAAGFAFYLAWPRGEAVLVRVYAWAKSPGRASLVAGLVVCIACGAYWLRQANRVLYGIIEVVFAFSSIVIVLQADRTPETRTATLVGLTYFFVRGLDNFFGGAKTARQDAWKKIQDEKTRAESLALVQELEAYRKLPLPHD